MQWFNIIYGVILDCPFTSEKPFYFLSNQTAPAPNAIAL